MEANWVLLQAGTYIIRTRNSMNGGFQYNAYLLLYFLWEVDNATQSIINFICTPLLLVLHLTLKLFGRKTTWEKRREQMASYLYDSEKGLSMLLSHNTFGGLIGLLEVAAFNFIQAIIGVQLYSFVFENMVGLVLFVVVIGGGGYILNSLLIDDKKTPSYFKRFDKEFKGRKWKYRLRCIIVLLLIITILVCSFVAYAYSCL